jgi:RNA polymerase sigma-70 factor (family 1)
LHLWENMMEYCEESLISKIINGNPIAFKRVYERHSRKLFYSILRLVKSEELAEELMQEVFVKIWENRTILNPDLSFKAYLFKVAENHVLDFFRKVAREKNLREKLISLAIHSHNRTEDHLLYQEYELLANRAIELLPPQRKRIFQMCRLEGLSYDKVGEGLDISKSTVSDHMVKAIKFIKEYLHTHADIVFLAALLIN